MGEELYSRSLVIRQKGVDTNIWYWLDADYITHTPQVNQLAPPLYREGNRALERWRVAQSPSNSGRDSTETLLQLWLNSKRALLWVLAPNCLPQGKKEFIEELAWNPGSKWAEFEKPEINLDWTRVLERLAPKMNSWYKFSEWWLLTEVKRLMDKPHLVPRPRIHGAAIKAFRKTRCTWSWPLPLHHLRGRSLVFFLSGTPCPQFLFCLFHTILSGQHFVVFIFLGFQSNPRVTYYVMLSCTIWPGSRILEMQNLLPKEWVSVSERKGWGAAPYYGRRYMHICFGFGSAAIALCDLELVT